MSGGAGPGADLDAFAAVISWAPGASVRPILGGYLDVLADRAAVALARSGGAARLDALEGRTPGGLLAVLTWPPVAAALLGRSPASPESMLGGWPGHPPVPVLGAGPAVLRRPAWLHGEGPGVDLAGADWVASGERLVAAWSVLDAVGDDVAGVARLLTRVICPRHDARPDVVGSWSTDELIGCTVVVGAGRHADPATLAELLVHEAVHHCQGMVEVARPFVVDRALTAGPERHPSPWTGVPLTAKSLLAACFVWFSLAHLWERARPVLGDRRVDGGLRRAVRGFVDGDPAGTVAGFAWALDPDVPEVVARLQGEVRRRWGG